MNLVRLVVIVSSLYASGCVASSACVTIVEPTADVDVADPHVALDSKGERACIPEPDLRGAWPSPGNI